MRSFFAILLLLAAVPAQAQPADRGQLLYETHCIECHSRQMHWRDQRLARDWNTLAIQVRRFQSLARLEWSEDDVQAVTQHLNATIYRFPQPPAHAQAAR